MDNTNKKCRNCGGREFYSKGVPLKGETLIPVGVVTGGVVHLRVCGSCGLLEWFIAPDTLEKVKRKFSKDS